MSKEKYDKYYDNKRPFHLVKGSGTGGVTILIRKNLATWLFRLFVFGEFSRYVEDSRGMILVYNKITEVAGILDGKRKVHAKYNGWGYDDKEWECHKYNEAWDGKMFDGCPESVTAKQLIKDPYCFWVNGYKSHFLLEKPTKRRKHFAYYKPVIEGEEYI